MSEIKRDTASSLVDIISLTQENTKDTNGCWFRGHSNSEYMLIPSVFRPSEGTTNNSSYYNEKKLLDEFIRCHPEAKEKHTDTIELLTYAQHYGLPTRLLDWSENLLVAVYFACCANLDADGEVFIFKSDKFEYENLGMISNVVFNTKFITSSISCVTRKGLLREAINIADSTFFQPLIKINGESIERLKEVGVSGFLRFEDSFNITFTSNGSDRSAKHSGSFFRYNPPLINQRLVSQSGCFTLHAGKIIGKNEVISVIPMEQYEGISEVLSSIIIPADAKESILRSLKSCGIDKARLFPELEYQIESIRERCK